MTRVVFLDVDGVLNSAATYQHVGTPAACQGPGFEAICPSLAARLNGLLKAAGAVIVLSSAWRYQNVRKNAKMLHALHVRGRVVGHTPRLQARNGETSGLWVAAARWEEVQAWLWLRGRALGVEQFVILDEIEDFGPLAAHHVQVDAAVGLTDADVARALAVLGG